MKIEKISNRNIVFVENTKMWDLNLHLIIGRKYNYIIDTGLGSHSVIPIQEYLGNNNNPIVIINTHYHWDHIWGNWLFDDCNIISHNLCRELILANWDIMIEKNKHSIRGEVKICLPNIVFEENVYFPDDGIRIFYTPGHSIDCISVYDEQDKILNVGDNIGDTIKEIVPYLEIEKNIYKKSILKYKTLPINACISGHNSILGKEVFDIIEKKLGS